MSELRMNDQLSPGATRILSRVVPISYTNPDANAPAPSAAEEGVELVRTAGAGGDSSRSSKAHGSSSEPFRLFSPQRGAVKQILASDSFASSFFTFNTPHFGAAGPRAHFRTQGESSNGSGSGLPLPQVGSVLFGFRLLYELGRGAFALVFLAEQEDLAGRPVVLKISAIQGNEPQTLAQLQHTHIVPIYSLHEDIRAGMRAVCMPYFGGASLANILKRLESETKRPVDGRQLVDCLEAVQAPSLEAVKAVGQVDAPSPSPPPLADDAQTPLTQLRRLAYPQAVAWIIARLADGLQHAHERGILHRDIKPANILLGSDGQPLLLDFNLAENTHCDSSQATVGGTISYMAPEHLRSMSKRHAPAPLVDERSDVYSLGMVLYEMLTGVGPFEQSAGYSTLPIMIEAMALERSQNTPSLRQRRPDLPWSLESIVRRCLAPAPADRYQQAAQLATDLRRFLDDQPLRYAPELSKIERVQKWTRRHPRLTSMAIVAAVACIVLTFVGTTLAVVSDHLHDATQLLTVNRAREKGRAFDAGTVLARCLVNSFNEVEDHLQQGRAECEQTLAIFGILDDDEWQKNPYWQSLAPEERLRLAQNAQELLLLLASAHVRQQPSDPNVVRAALQLLDRAEAIEDLGPTKALWLERARYWELLADPVAAAEANRQAAALEPLTARDYYLSAIAHVRDGSAQGLNKAIAELNQALTLNPREYWAAMQLGLCHQQRGEFDLAVGDFGECIGIWAEFAWGHFNLGCAYDQCGRRHAAIAAYTKAIAYDPDFIASYVNRGLACLELKRYEQALKDFDAALAAGKDTAALHAGRGMALEALARPAEADRAFANAFGRLDSLPEDKQARLRWTYGFAVAKRLPDKAQASFDRVLQDDPNHAEALYGRAMLAMQRGQLAEAVRFFTQALDHHPKFIQARRYRAIALARRGDWAEAGEDINWCLDRDGESAATLYAAACVAARAADRRAIAQALPQALDFVKKAFAQGADPDVAVADSDLAALRTQPKFQHLIRDARRARAAGTD